MKITLITGLDGTGKTTLLNKLKENGINEKQIINVPQINLNILTEDNELYKLSEFVNKLSKVADVLQIPQIKAVALFASMLIFSKLLESAKKNNFKEVFCERHPLIDTGVYAQFYASKLMPGNVDKNFLQKLDEKNKEELDSLLSLLPSGYIDEELGRVENLMNFIYRWFYKESKTSIQELKELFKVEMPNEIYFLKASPEFLIERLLQRQVLEAHETKKALELMDGAYSDFFKEIKAERNQSVNIIDIMTVEKVNSLIEQLTR